MVVEPLLAHRPELQQEVANGLKAAGAASLV